MTYDETYAAIPTLDASGLKQVRDTLTARRRAIVSDGADAPTNEFACLDFLLGEIAARTGDVKQAFAHWESSLSHGPTVIWASLGGQQLSMLVNFRRLRFAGQNPNRLFRILLFGSFAPAVAVFAEIVPFFQNVEATKVQWNAKSLQFDYNWTQCTLTDVLAALPKGWTPDVILVNSFESCPVPVGIEAARSPVVAWIGDIPNYFRTIAPCLPMLSLIVVDQERDVDFVRALGYDNVISIMQQSVQPNVTLFPRKPYGERAVDIAFFGTLDTFPVYAYRREIVRRLLKFRSEYRVAIFENTESLFDMFVTLNDTKIGVNVDGEFVGKWHPHPYRYICSRRVFEIAASGAVCMTPETTLNVATRFVPGSEIVTFRPDDPSSDAGHGFEAKLRYYLERPEEAAQIAAAGRTRAMNEHTAWHRAKALVERLGERSLRDALSGRRMARTGILEHQYLASGAVYGVTEPWGTPKDGSAANVTGSLFSTLYPPARDTDRAIQRQIRAEFDAAIEANPSNLVYRLNRFSYAVECGDWAAAMEYAAELLALLDGKLDGSAFDGLIRQPVYTGEKMRGVPWWRTDLRMTFANAYYADPQRGEPFVDTMRRHLQVAMRDYLGCLLTLEGRPDEAQAYWREAYELDADDEFVAWRLAESCASQGELDAALGWTEEAMRVRPFNARNTILRALLCERLGREDEAADLFGSLIYRKLRSREDAVAWYESTTELLPSFQ